jgi:hypothetical protein
MSADEGRPSAVRSAVLGAVRQGAAAQAQLLFPVEVLSSSASLSLK